MGSWTIEDEREAERARLKKPSSLALVMATIGLLGAPLAAVIAGLGVSMLEEVVYWRAHNPAREEWLVAAACFSVLWLVLHAGGSILGLIGGVRLRKGSATLVQVGGAVQLGLAAVEALGVLAGLGVLLEYPLDATTPSMILLNWTIWVVIRMGAWGSVLARSRRIGLERDLLVESGG